MKVFVGMQLVAVAAAAAEKNSQTLLNIHGHDQWQLRNDAASTLQNGAKCDVE